MAPPLERWARQAVLLEQRGHYEPVAPSSVPRDIETLAQLERATWARREREILESGHPIAMPVGAYGAIINVPNAATITTTSISGTANLWPGAVYSVLPANLAQMPQAFRVAVAAKITTSTSPANIGFDPRVGTSAWTTGGTALTGTTLGASTNVALTASITNAFYVVTGNLTIRSGGVPGANWSIVGMFQYISTQGTTGGLAGPAATGTGHNLLFGGTGVSYDGSVASGLQLGAVHTVTTITHNVESIHVMAWN